MIKGKSKFEELVSFDEKICLKDFNLLKECPYNEIICNTRLYKVLAKC